MSVYKGSAQEGGRAAALLKKREREKEELEAKKAALARDMERSTMAMSSKFSATIEDAAARVRARTYGLVTLEQMKAAQEAVEEEMQAAAQVKPVETKRKRVQDKVVVSFNMDEEEEEDDGDDGSGSASGSASGKGLGKKKDAKDSGEAAKGASNGVEGGEKEEEEAKRQESPTATNTAAAASIRASLTGKAAAAGASGDDEEQGALKRKRVSKDPLVDTSFLPDREREERELAERKRLEEEWAALQHKTKDEPIVITYSYWDGSGHRRSIRMKKGNSVHELLQGCLVDLRKEFPELRGVSADSLIMVKEDLIIPTSYTFYDFIVTKARGKSGPLFNFDAFEDVRLVNDSAVEKEESHAAKIMLKAWYERNKHIFPASRWEAYDPAKKWDKYTIKDTGKKQ